MVGSFRLGRLFGIEVNVHWSWVFIFVLVTWTFASGILSELFKDWTDLQRWVIGGLIAAVFFSSILFHEISHSLVARRYNIPVSSITLFVFGGVSNLTKEPETAGQEFWIAIVGPLTSLAFAAVFGAAYFALEPIDHGAAGVAANLAVINVMIGVFNLVPGFPLDGGRVLRSIFWSRNRSLLDATRMASRVGQGVAYLIMGGGVVMLLTGLLVSGIWFLLIGNFLRSASAASYEQLFLETVLKGVLASDVARTDYTPIGPELRLSELVEEHVLAGTGRAYPVMAGEELLGLITLSDVLKVPREQWPVTTVYRAMTPVDRLKTVAPRDPLRDVLVLMATNDINQVPVMEGRWLRGMLHRADVLRYIQVRQVIGSGAATH